MFFEEIANWLKDGWFGNFLAENDVEEVRRFFNTTHAAFIYESTLS